MDNERDAIERQAVNEETGAVDPLVISRVIAMGWHCFSFHCKYSDCRQTPTLCRKHDTRCYLDNCEVFRNGRAV